MMTRTHTSYWSPDDVVPLTEAIQALRKDYSERMPYIDSEAVHAMAVRLNLLENAAQLLTDWAD